MIYNVRIYLKIMLQTSQHNSNCDNYTLKKIKVHFLSNYTVMIYDICSSVEWENS
jgi:hypothetical protein